MNKCKHNKAFPISKVMWCPDCGAIREMRYNIITLEYVFRTNKWLYPRGRENVLKQLEKIKDIFK